MPSSPNYKRDYKQEATTAKARGETPGNIERKRARRKLESLGMVHVNDGKDVDHKKPISKGGSNKTSNLRAVSEHANRSFPRNPSGSMK